MFPLRILYFVVLFFSPHIYREKKKNHHYCGDIKNQCEARQSGWHWKGVKGGDVLPFLCYCFTDPWPHLFLVAMCVWVGCGLSFMPDPAADVTFLHVEATRSASHTHLCTSHTSPTGNVCFLLQFSLWLPLRAQRKMSSTFHSCAARLKFSLHVWVN